MTIIGPAVLEIIRTQNRNFECVRRETKKEKKKKKKKGKLATRYLNAMLRTALMSNSIRFKKKKF
jgi:hypothetical protein